MIQLADSRGCRLRRCERRRTTRCRLGRQQSARGGSPLNQLAALVFHAHWMAPSIVTAAPPSPRSRRHSSITPLTVAMPTPSYDESSRPSSPTFHRARMFDLQRTLYGSQDKDEIRELVEEEYDQNASKSQPSSPGPADDCSVRESAGNGAGPDPDCRHLLSARLAPRFAVVRAGGCG